MFRVDFIIAMPYAVLVGNVGDVVRSRVCPARRPFAPSESLRTGFELPLGERARLAPLYSCLRRIDALGGVQETRVGECGKGRVGGAGITRRGCAGRTRDGDGPSPRPCPGFPLLQELRWGWGGKDDAWGRPPSSVLRTGFDRLRANGRASSLWVAPCAGGLSALGLY